MSSVNQANIEGNNNKKNIDPQLLDHLTTDFKWLHRHPELALHEVETTRYIKQSLSEIPGVELLDLGLETGALARIVGDPAGPTIAIRADIDALPMSEESGVEYASENAGCMHACGHDFHTTSLLGVARILSERKEELKGTVMFLFQPAEEAEHGGEKVVKTGLFDKYPIRQFFGQHVRPKHPVGTIAISAGPFSAACDKFVYTIKGKGCHGSAPQNGLDPITAGARLVGNLQEIVSRRIGALDKAVVSVTQFHSGSSWNIIPDTAVLEGTIRSFDPVIRKRIIEIMHIQAKALELEGYEVSLEYSEGCPATNNDPALADMVRKIAHAHGFETVEQPADMGGEDFSCFQELVPGAFYHIGVNCEYPIHNTKFKVDTDALAGGASLMAEVAIEALKNIDASQS